jgi:hypothetical protein
MFIATHSQYGVKHLMHDIYGTAMPTLPVWLLAELATSAPRLALWGLRWLYGGLRFMHLVGMAGFFGCLLLLELRGLGLFAPGALDVARPRLGRMLGGAFWITVASGVVLFLYDPLVAGLHSMFLPKLLLVSFGYALTRLRRRVRLGAGWAQGGAALSLAVWLLVIGASTWNHVERPVHVTAALRAAAVGK